MKKSFLLYVLVVMSCTLFHGSVLAQIMPPDLYVLQVYPTSPSANDSVVVSLTYTSNDGCPDYYLVKDSVESFMVSIAIRKIDNSNKVCTQAFTKFVTKINLGTLRQSTRIYVDGALVQTVNPICTLDKKGVVVKGSGACFGKLLISEYTPYASLLPCLYTMDKIVVRNANSTTPYNLKVGDEVKFSAIFTAPDTSKTTCHILGDAVCGELISSLPDCLMNKTGVIVPGIDGCTGLWFVKDLSPVYSYPRLYLIKNDGSLKAGAKVIFGATEYSSDSLRSILCPIFGLVSCFFYAEPLHPDTLAGTAFKGDSVVKAGMAILFQKGYRKALRANPLKEGRFVFPNLPAADYTVYIIPDKTLDSGYLPTFYINKLAFKNADYYTLQDGLNEIAVNLRKFEKRPGKGKIYGNVYFETSNLKDSILNYYGEKNYLYTTDNTTAVNLPVILFNAQGVPIAWTMSDDKGNYVFDNIALDSYRIVTETAETAAESTVSLTQENAVVGADMVLKVQNVVDELPAVKSDAFSMYPNPVSDKLYIQTTSDNAVVRIYNNLGQLKLEHVIPAGNNVLDVQMLNQGVYFVKVGMHTQKMIRK
jgi:hypothetical protein